MDGPVLVGEARHHPSLPNAGSALVLGIVIHTHVTAKRKIGRSAFQGGVMLSSRCQLGCPA